MNGKLWAGDKALSFKSYSDTPSITQIILATDENAEDAFYAGEEGYSLTVYCPWATQQMANDLLEKAQGFRYQGYEASMAGIPGSAERGDGVTVGGVYGMLADRTVYFNPGMNSDISAPYEEEVNHEFQYVSPIKQSLERKIGQVQASLTVDIDSITQQITGINGELTQITADIAGVQQTVQDQSGSISTLTQKVNNITLSVSNRETSSSISLNVNGITVSSQTIYFTGDVVFASDLSSGYTTVSGDCITTGQVSAEYIKLGGKMEVYQSTWGNSSGGYIGYMSGMSASGSSTAGIAIADATQSAVMICTNSGARMGYDGVSTVVCTSTQVSIRGNAVYINGEPATTSDRNAKTDIETDMDSYLAVFDRLSPVSFRYNTGSRRHLGLIAQDVEQALKDVGMGSENFGALCYEPPGEEYPDGQYSLRYGELIPLLIAKIQQLEKEIASWTKT